MTGTYDCRNDPDHPMIPLLCYCGARKYPVPEDLARLGVRHPCVQRECFDRHTVVLHDLARCNEMARNEEGAP